MQNPLALAERIVNLRLELSKAESEFTELVGGLAARTRQVKFSVPGVPVAARVRSLLKDKGTPLTFGEIKTALGDAKTEAIKSSLKKARDGGTIGFRGFKYYWKATNGQVGT